MENDKDLRPTEDDIGINSSKYMFSRNLIGIDKRPIAYFVEENQLLSYSSIYFMMIFLINHEKYSQNKYLFPLG